MGIDRIGRPGPAVPPPSAGQASPVPMVERPFSTERAVEAGSASPVASARSPLDQLRAGAIDLNQYLEIKVDEATSHLAGMAPAQLDAVRSALRERLSQDPTLGDLVRKVAAAVDVP